MEKPENKPLHILAEWRIDKELPRDFHRKVWARLAAAETRRAGNPLTLFVGWVGSSLSRPGIAASYIMLLLLLGLAAGYGHAQSKAGKTKQAERQAYVQMIDPYQMPRP